MHHQFSNIASSIFFTQIVYSFNYFSAFSYHASDYCLETLPLFFSSPATTASLPWVICFLNFNNWQKIASSQFFIFCVKRSTVRESPFFRRWQFLYDGFVPKVSLKNDYFLFFFHEIPNFYWFPSIFCFSGRSTSI